ncbi:MAG: AMP-binding protein [Bacteroidales bacterium]|nr:AMP-binding protein [Bacteroidales bacterium]
MNVFDYLFENTSSLNKNLVLGNKEKISYQQIYDNTLSVTQQIIDSFGTENNIILLSENSVFFITAYLAIMKSGNVCVPLNPALEDGSLKEIIEKTESKIAFVSKRFFKKLENYDLNLIDNELVEKWTHLNPGSNSQSFASDFEPEKLAQIIFTSGSTGEQKGVMLSHKNLIANTGSILDYLHLTSEDTILIVMPFYYCYGLSLLHTHLRIGGSVVLNNSFVFIGTVINDLNKYACTGFSGVPSHFQILLRKTKDFKTTQFETLRYVTQAGGKLHNAFIQEFLDAFPQISFFVMYGQTEATARLSYLPPEQLPAKLGSMGKGIPNVELQVVNNDGLKVKAGEVGEIIARGDNIMQGYFKDPETTAKTLKNGWLYTGDMATVDEEGYIFIQSRAKEIIKVRGIRISPKEIEEVIVEYPGVVDCTIVAMEDEIAGEALKAIVYINDADKDSFLEDDIRKHCAEQLASHKVPQFVEFQTKLIFNAAGKKTKAAINPRI